MFTIFNRRISRALVAAILPLSMGLRMASNVVAETSPFDPSSNQQAPDAQHLTIDSIAQMLQTMGVAFEKSGDGLILKVTDKDGMTFPIFLQIGQSKAYVWLDCNLVKANQANQQELMNLLTANQKYGIATFCVDGEYLELQMSVPNIGITADVLRAQLKAYFSTLEETKAMWNVPAPAPSQPTNPFGS